MTKTSEQLLREMVRILDEKKAVNVKAINISRISPLADYFLIASGTSSTQVHALAEELEDQLSRQEIEPKRIEGMQGANWILLDYGDIIVHIFHTETRQFYSLERLWVDGETVNLSDILRPNGPESDQ